MTIKFGRKHLFIIALCALLWNQQVSILSQKIAIENSYQQKVSSAVSRMLGQEPWRSWERECAAGRRAWRCGGSARTR